eukprot:3575217-Prymnesium_polylepis.1
MWPPPSHRPQPSSVAPGPPLPAHADSRLSHASRAHDRPPAPLRSRARLAAPASDQVGVRRLGPVVRAVRFAVGDT